MSENKSFDVVVIGGGPGGYPAAIRLAQEGKKVALIEEREMGGTCLNRGCIPTKTLIANTDVLKKVKEAQEFGIVVGKVSFDYEKMSDRKDSVVGGIRKSLEGLIKANQITSFKGRGKIDGPGKVKVLGDSQVLIEAKQIIIATGSEPMEIPAFPFDGKLVHDSTSLLNLKKLPEKLLVIGGGYIGCEFASMFAELGVKVTIVEALERILPGTCTSVANVLEEAFTKRGIEIQKGVFVEGIEKGKKGIEARLSHGPSVKADMCIACVGRRPNSKDIGLESVGISPNEKGFIEVDAQMRTEAEGIYAIGDVTGQVMLAHVASHQGLVAADNILGKHAEMNYDAIPAIIFTHPEIATVGLTIGEATERGIPATVGKFPFQALGKSQAAIETEGFAQVITHKETGQLLGAQVIGHEAGTLIAEMGVAVANELTVDCLIETIHAHPTIAESWLEAALVSKDMPLHLPPKKKRKEPCPA